MAVTGDPPRLLLVPPASSDLARAATWLLGLDDHGPVFAAVTADGSGRVDGRVDGRGVGLREVAPLLDDAEGALLATATGLAAWHAEHGYCPRCGAPTEVAEAGWLRVCTRDGSWHHPRVDPAVIMAVTDADDRLLLGRQARWPPRRFSTLAGFVEPGESLEQAVAREVHEEVNVDVADATYLGSQPWPFPRSLMLGFVARASSTAITVDEVEIAEARWFTRRELPDATATREVLLPPPVSISRRLIEHWYGGPLPERERWT